MKPIPKGARITCENGHHICDVAETIEKYALIKFEQFENWQQAPPKPYTAFDAISCEVCAAKWVRLTENSGAELHLEEGWSGSME